MTADCSLNYKCNTWKFQAQTWGEHGVYRNCFWHSEQFFTQHVLPMFCKKKNFWQRFTCTVALYYNTVIAWCLYYFGQSFSSPLPWSKCPKILNELNKTFEYSKECGVAGSTQFFWYRETLDIAANITEPSSFNFTLAFCLLLAWILVRMSCKTVQNHC